MTPRNAAAEASRDAEAGGPAQTLTALFVRALGKVPDRTFLAMEHGQLTYAQAADWSAALANGLAAAGVKAADRVAILSANRPEMVMLWLACLRVGACFCPLNLGFTGHSSDTSSPGSSPR